MSDNKESNNKKEKFTAHHYGELRGLNRVQVRALKIIYGDRRMPEVYWKKELKESFNV